MQTSEQARGFLGAKEGTCRVVLESDRLAAFILLLRWVRAEAGMEQRSARVY